MERTTAKNTQCFLYPEHDDHLALIQKELMKTPRGYVNKSQLIREAIMAYKPLELKGEVN